MPSTPETWVRESSGGAEQAALRYFAVNVPPDRFSALRGEFRQAGQPAAADNDPCRPADPNWSNFFAWLSTRDVPWEMRHQFLIMCGEPVNADPDATIDSPSQLALNPHVEILVGTAV